MIPLILGIVGALIVVSNWDEITDWIREVLHKGHRILAKAIKKAGKIVIRFLAKSENQTTQVREISEKEVPDYVLNKIKNTRGTVDITNELEDKFYQKDKNLKTIPMNEVPSFIRAKVITDWIQDTIHEGYRILARIINKTGKIVIKLLAKSKNQIVRTKEILEGDLPYYILNKIKNNLGDIDITDELKNELNELVLRR